MSELKDKLFQELSDAVVDMDEDKTVATSHRVIEEGIDAYEAIENGLAHGMDRVGELFDQEEYFIPEVLMSSDAMYAGVEVLKPHLKATEQGEKTKVVIGVVEGDTHDIGKNLVKIMLETSGFEVIDLGRDIPPQQFVDKATEVGAQIIGLATLMTTTMDGMHEVIRILEQKNIRSQFKVMIGGGPISQAFADKIGADSYAVNAADAVRKARKLVS
ncbi:corrinoid protein [Heliophilum fasciatum]|uniref:Corrinoid protein of di/trimethylamine methyltransferase n=1 Tax=Heliophilum fasciatum TaxID=35700 RepID=A0A4R2S0L5_9FIRM|nr:corrinoid protein [Heliophilum fasciatum]MCW2276660.1 corrinoid protein of di/trimethylamine methyltransferase [Heliophilum fasciatum]TCP68959.1 corrinoid protein of di/trimethylamine methyltransferase [Heliophilum fasciatum]